MSFIQRLEARSQRSLLCVGLDPHPEELAAQSGEACYDFCMTLVEATCEVAAAFKPNIAFFERLGAGGFTALERVITAIPDDIPVIIDAKRGDISSTALAYAETLFELLGGHAVTLNPYLGKDSIEPFVAHPDRAAFLLCRTSNPGAADLQERMLVGEPCETLYECVAHLANHWKLHNNVGLVVGATCPEALARVRAIAPRAWILAPGVGAQGGNLEGALQNGLRDDSSGVLITISRGISRADDPALTARALCEHIESLRSHHATTARRDGHPIKNSARCATRLSSPSLEALADALLEHGCVQFGSFTLRSGKEAPIYIDLRKLISRPRLLMKVARAYLDVARTLDFDQLAALPYAALPIGTALSLLLNVALVYPRHEAKSHGTKVLVEGDFQRGQTALVIDDVISSGGSIMEGVAKLRESGLIVNNALVLIDRIHQREGLLSPLAHQNVQLHSVMTLESMLSHWLQSKRVAPDLIEASRAFLRSQT